MTIVVPYRERENHLAQFIPHMNTRFPELEVIAIEQAAGKQWNREKLFNVAVRECMDDFYVFHDIDMLADVSMLNYGRFKSLVDYSPRIGVTQLASSSIQRQDYLGGVTMFDRETYLKVGGYHNEFWGGRAGDNEMRFNLKRLGVPVLNRFGKFINLPHPRTGPEFIPELWEKAQQPRDVQDQLSICEYTVISKTTTEYTHILVDI